MHLRWNAYSHDLLISIKMLIGYARVNTSSKSFDSQVKALKKAGCQQIFTGVALGLATNCKALKKAIDLIQQGDSLVVCNFTKLTRNASFCLKIFDVLQDKGAGFMSLKENMNVLYRKRGLIDMRQISQFMQQSKPQPIISTELFYKAQETLCRKGQNSEIKRK